MAKLKRAFIPKMYRPYVPGTQLQESSYRSYSFERCSKTVEETAVFVIASREDIIPLSFLKMVTTDIPLYQLYYDDLGSTWDFSFYKDVLKIFTHNHCFIPHAIYHRHPGVGSTHRYYQKHCAFWEVIDQWSGIVLGQRQDHHHNCSKMYQAISTIRTARDIVRAHSVRIPRSFFIKGDSSLMKKCLRRKLIVKSCSGVRSKIASQKTFKRWNLKHIRNVPTLFQEKIRGKDVRVHVCVGSTWALIVASKDYIDYRYATPGSVVYQEIKLDKPLEDFCRTLAQIEQNELVGIDFLKSGKRYFCLESNPGPGWSAFNHISREKFAQLILNALK